MKKWIIFFFLILAVIIITSIQKTSGQVMITGKVIGSVCGNGVIVPGEQCNGINLGGQTCQGVGYSGGTLTCNSNCTFNTSQCILPGVNTIPAGNGNELAPINVSFSGYAYPMSNVTLLKDSQIIASTIAGGDSAFNITVSGLNQGNYVFSIYSQDINGIRSSFTTFPIEVTPNISTDVKGIFIAPTIEVNKSIIKRGDTLTIFGQSAPSSTVTIAVHSQNALFATTSANKDGSYLYYLNTSNLDYGSHTAESKSAIGNNLASDYGNSASFDVGQENVTTTNQTCGLTGDLNCDNKVNIIDFSIMAYWFNRPNPPLSVDLNGDGKIDLVDFSILAYYWTG